MNDAAHTPPLPEGWSQDATGLHTTLTFRRWRRAWDFVGVLKDLAEAADHHPDLQLSFNTLKVTLLSHDRGEVTSRDHAMAATIQQALAEEELTEQTP